MAFSEKQKEYVKHAHRRWNFKTGAMRSGKTYLDLYLIPMRLRALAGREGLTVFIGNTRGTLLRNIISPLQAIWGTQLVSSIRADNTATLFGETVYCLGAEKQGLSDRLRGMSIKYCYGDEVATWNPEVFTMLKSRLDKPYSLFDGTANPEHPGHWLRRFLESHADIFLQEYTLDDNPYLAESVREHLKNEYRGTVYYDRYILGKWVNAEGLIYPLLAENPSRFLIQERALPALYDLAVGIDFGGNRSNHAMVLSGTGADGALYFLRADTRSAYGTQAEHVVDWCVRTAEDYYRAFPYRFSLYPDAAEQTLKNSIEAKSRFPVYNSIKRPIIDRIRLVNRLLAENRIRFLAGACDTLIKAFSEALWDEKSLADIRLDNGSFNNDVIDAAEYSFGYSMPFFERSNPC